MGFASKGVLAEEVMANERLVTVIFVVLDAVCRAVWKDIRGREGVSSVIGPLWSRSPLAISYGISHVLTTCFLPSEVLRVCVGDWELWLSA